ncbi:MAG TPA: EamA family transporter [Bryobacteraceae bacterium]|nr:EamA family transporter [Bryobacteraceae bacterium]
MGLVTNATFIAILAQGLIGMSLVWDKILLRRPATKTLSNYVFWLGSLSVLGLLLIPFGFRLPGTGMAALGVGAGVIHLAANWFYYRALKLGEASQTLAVVGGFSPLATGVIGFVLLSKPLGDTSVLGFSLLVAGGFVMFLAEKFNWRCVLPSVLLSAFLFGITNVLQKIVFNGTGFVTGYVFFTIGTFLGAMGLLLRPLWREQIFHQSEEAPPRSKLWYFVNRFISGVGSFLIFFAISRGSPAVVDAISGVRYAIIFVGVYVITTAKPEWLREDFRRPTLIGKGFATALITAGLVLVGSRSPGGGADVADAQGRASRATPQPTIETPTHLCHRTSSFSMILASTVSSRTLPAVAGTARLTLVLVSSNINAKNEMPMAAMPARM